MVCYIGEFELTYVVADTRRDGGSVPLPDDAGGGLGLSRTVQVRCYDLLSGGNEVVTIIR